MFTNINKSLKTNLKSQISTKFRQTQNQHQHAKLIQRNPNKLHATKEQNKIIKKIQENHRNHEFNEEIEREKD